MSTYLAQIELLGKVSSRVNSSWTIPKTGQTALSLLIIILRECCKNCSSSKYLCLVCDEFAYIMYLQTNRTEQFWYFDSVCIAILSPPVYDD